MVWIDRPHWSYSAVQQYLRCSLQYFFQRIAKIPEPFISSGLALGSAIHSTLADYHIGIRTGIRFTNEELADRFVDHWTTKERSAPIQYRPDESRESILEQGAALLDLYLSEEPPTNILAVEETMIVPIVTSQGEVLERPLVAVADLITLEEGTPKVTEFKTSSRSYSESANETSLQATCYAYATEEILGTSATVEYVILVKTKVPKLQRQPTERSPESFGRIGDLVQMIERAVDSDVFYPNESTINCSNCCYRKHCKEWPNRMDSNICFESDERKEMVPC